MKTSIGPVTLIIGIAIASVGAAPVGVIPTTDPTSVNGVETKILAFRLGHAAGLGRLGDYRIADNLPAPKSGCKVLLGKAQSLSDGLRRIFSLASIVRPASGAHASGPVPHHGPESSEGTLHILPFIPSDSTSSSDPALYHSNNVHHHNHHNHPFVARLGHAIRSLGPWEARVVAFVLGCGFGALLRILFMFCLIAIRALRNRSQQHVELSEDAAILLPVEGPIPSSEPPAYGDEKVTLREMIADDVAATPFSEEHVKAIETIGLNVITNGLSVYWTSIMDELHETPIDEFKQFAPKALLSFYEANLRWKEVSE